MDADVIGAERTSGKWEAIAPRDTGDGVAVVLVEVEVVLSLRELRDSET